MFTAANTQAIIQAGLHYILGTKEREVGYVIDAGRRAPPGQADEDGQIWEHADRHGRGPDGGPHSRTIYQYSWDRVRRTLKGIEEQLPRPD